MQNENNDLISREALRKALHNFFDGKVIDEPAYILRDVFCHIDSAPTVETYYTNDDVLEAEKEGYERGKKERPQGEWIPVSERLPNDLEPVNITWINHEPEPYYKEIKDKPFTATGVYFNGQWYWWSTLCTDILAEYSHNFDDVIDTAIEVIAWQPLPEPYKKGGADMRGEK